MPRQEAFPVVDLRKKQVWLQVPKAALDVLDDPYLGYPGELPVKETGDEILSLAESFLAKVLLGQGHGLGMLYGYRREIERRTREEAFREGIGFALNALRRLATSRQDVGQQQAQDDLNDARAWHRGPLRPRGRRQ